MKNIRNLLFVILLSSLSYGLFAQESRFQFGIKAGGDLYSTTLDVGDDIDKKVKPCFHVGLTAEYAFSETAYLQTGVGYVTKGAVIKDTENIANGSLQWTQKFSMQYIQVPVMFAYKLMMVSDVQIYFHGGPYFAYGIGGKSTYETKEKSLADVAKGKEKQDSFSKDGLKKFDYGIKFGAGLEFEKFVVGLDFEYGLANISQKKSGLSPLLEGKNFRNKGVSLSVGYKF